MKHKNYLVIPNTEQRVYDNSVVMLDRFPNTRWILHVGWYSYLGQQYRGWYFQSIPARTIIPVNRKDLTTLVIISNAVGPKHPDKKPHPGPYPEHMYPPGPAMPHKHCHGPHHKPEHKPGPDMIKPPCHPVPKKPTSVIKTPEKYFGGNWYAEGQLIYLNAGDLYQAAQSFRSSWKGKTNEDNLKSDIGKGHLVEVPGSAIAAMEGLQKEMESLAIKKFRISFEEAFGTARPTKSDADDFLAELTPPLEPSIYIYFKNMDKDSETSGHIFTYYEHPTKPNRLVFINDELDTVVDISGKADKDFAGVGGYVIQDISVSKTADGFELELNSVSPEGEPPKIESKSYKLSDLDIASETDLNTKMSKDISDENRLNLIGAGIGVEGTDITFDTRYGNVDTGTTNIYNKQKLPIADLGLPSHTDLDTKVDKTVAGVGEKIVKDLETEGVGDGFKATQTKLSLEDGVTTTKEELVTLSQMGAVSNDTFVEALTWKDVD